MPHSPTPPESPKSTRSRRRGTVVLAVAAVLLNLAAIWLAWEWRRLQPTERFDVMATIDDVPRSIPIEAFLPGADSSAGRSYPAVVLLHGVEGAARYRSAHYRTARRLVDQGYAVFFVHYFRGGDYEDLWKLREDGELDLVQIDAACRRDAASWTKVVARTLIAIASRPEVDRSRIALDGNSLGGFVALSAASAAIQDDDIPDPRAVVVNWGALFDGTVPSHGFAPTLFVHGANDTTVPLESARRSADALRAVGTETSLFVVPGAPHVAWSRESEARTMQFLHKHLSSDASGAPLRDDELRALRGAAIGSDLWSMNSPFIH